MVGAVPLSVQGPATGKQVAHRVGSGGNARLLGEVVTPLTVTGGLGSGNPLASPGGSVYDPFSDNCSPKIHKCCTPAAQAAGGATRCLAVWRVVQAVRVRSSQPPRSSGDRGAM